jgi:hypothetical protein
MSTPDVAEQIHLDFIPEVTEKAKKEIAIFLYWLCIKINNLSFYK